MTFLNLAFLASVVGLGLVFARLAIKTAAAKSHIWSQAADHSPTFKDVAKGEIKTRANGRPDYSVSEGMAVDLSNKERRVIPQGKVSDELIEQLT